MNASKFKIGDLVSYWDFPYEEYDSSKKKIGIIVSVILVGHKNNRYRRHMVFGTNGLTKTMYDMRRKVA